MPVLPIRLGVNIDHVATVRSARAGRYPDPVKAAEAAIAAGADGITAHLREDRRHILDADVTLLKERINKPLNLEMAATAEMVRIARQLKPHAACIVPERRQERTTEGGLDAAGQQDALRGVVAELADAGIRVSLFIAAEPAQIEAAVKIGAPVIEIHTGTWCDAVTAGHPAAGDPRTRRPVAAPGVGDAAGAAPRASYSRRCGLPGGDQLECRCPSGRRGAATRARRASSAWRARSRLWSRSAASLACQKPSTTSRASGGPAMITSRSVVT